MSWLNGSPVLVESLLAAFFLLCTTDRNKANSFLAQLDLELIAWLQLQHCGVCLTDKQIAVALHGRYVAELSATLANTSTTT